MTARRILAGFALLLAACTTAACAQVVTGTGTVAADVQGGSSITSSPTASASASSTDDSSSDPSTSASSPSSSSSSSSSGGSDDTSPVCQALNKSTVEDLFGTSVSFGRSSTSGCQLQAEDGRSMIIAVFDYLKLSEYKKADTTDLTVAGHPGVKTSTTIIYVSRGSSADTNGLVAAYFAGLRDGGDTLAAKILAMVVPKFAK